MVFPRPRDEGLNPNSSLTSPEFEYEKKKKVRKYLPPFHED